MKLAAAISLLLFTSSVQARICTTSENLTCGIAPICTSEYTVHCSDGAKESFSGITGPLGWGKGAYPKVKKWTEKQGLIETRIGKNTIIFSDRSERSDARYCISDLLKSENAGIDGQVKLYSIYVSCPYDSADSKLFNLVTKEEVEAELASKGYTNITSDKTAKTQYYRYFAD